MFDALPFWIVLIAAMAVVGLVSWIFAGVRAPRRDLLDAQRRAAYAEAQLVGMEDQLQAREQALSEVRAQATELHAQNSGLQARLQAQKDQFEQQAKTLSDVRAELEREMKLLALREFHCLGLQAVRMRTSQTLRASKQTES